MALIKKDHVRQAFWGPRFERPLGVVFSQSCLSLSFQLLDFAFLLRQVQEDTGNLGDHQKTSIERQPFPFVFVFVFVFLFLLMVQDVTIRRVPSTQHTWGHIYPVPIYEQILRFYLRFINSKITFDLSLSLDLVQWTIRAGVREGWIFGAGENWIDVDSC